MALQLWMPLRGNLDNLGLADVGFVASSTVTSNNNGKIGKCYQFQGYTGYGIYRDSGITTSEFMDSYINSHSFSIACWVKTSSASTCICSLTYGIRLFAGNLTTFSIYTVESSNSIWLSSYGAKSNDNKWHHIVGVYDAETNNITTYVDGVAGKSVAWSGAGTYSSYWTNGLYIGRDCNSGQLTDVNFFQGLMNDFRIYDHALSQTEVHSLSQGLVVHYKMDDEYIEGTTNLSNAISEMCYNGANDKYGYNANSNMQKKYGFFQGRQCDKVSMIEAGLNARPYIYISNMFVSNGGSYPEYKTLSFDYYPTRGTYINPYKLGSGTSIAIYTVTNTETKTGLFTNSGNIPIVVNMWNHIEVTFHGATEASAEWGYIINGDTHTSTNSDYWLFANVLVEVKDHATPFTSSSRTALNSIQDYSGYQNNGTIVGNLTINNDSPRYDKSLYFSSSSNYITHQNVLDNTSQEWTVCCWVNPNQVAQAMKLNTFNLGNYIIYDSTNMQGLLYINNGNNDYYRYSSNNSIVYNEWFHIAFVFNYSKDIVSIYVNGLNVDSSKAGNNSKTPKGLTDTILVLNTFIGYACDYREYSTALSSDDILSLYQLGARIDNKKNLHTFEIEENGYNLLSPYTFPLAFNSYVKAYSQTNCTTSIQDNHYHIYRKPNISATGGDSLNWGGIYVSNIDNILGFQQGHHYLVCLNVRGYSDKAMTDVVINNNCGWSASSLIPTSADNIRTYNPVIDGYNSDTWDTVALYFEINSPLYKVLTGESYSIFVKGLSYLSFKDIKFGFTYTTTTSLGTNLELDNLRLYDVTNLDVLTKIKREGITLTISFIEDGDNGIIKNGDLQSNNIYEI